ncbi:MAG: RIP metalloprotease RseP, partial [Vicinamibacterales bacterium]|nr:RIP metalloprotease RseP [Vicinamibacterales bacterium]
AILVFAGMYATIGQPYTAPVIGTVQAGSAAEEAGFEPGDLVVSMDGLGVERFQEIQRIVRLNPGKFLDVVVERSGVEIAFVVTPRRAVQEDRFGNRQEIGRLGVTGGAVNYVRHGPLAALWEATRDTVRFVQNLLTAVGQIVTGQRSTDELGGPLRIAQMSGQVAQGGLVDLLFFTAVLSINLGLINLFPIPMLDGGHLVFYLIEAVRGRPLGPRAQEYGFRIGLALVLTLILFVTFNDLIHLQVFEYVRNLVG